MRRCGMIALCVCAGILSGAGRAPEREEVAKALEGTSHKRLDAKTALRYFQLVTAFDEATNSVAAHATAYALATEELEALEVEHGARFATEAGKQYLYERSSGKFYRLEVQAGTPPKVVRILERKLTPEEGQAYLAAQGARVEVAAKQQESLAMIGEEEGKATAALAALRKEFGVEDHAWADLYLVPGRTDVMLVQGRYPVVPVAPVVPTRSGEVPEGTFWVYDVDFVFPEKSGGVMSRLVDSVSRLEAEAPREVEHVSEEWGAERVEAMDLAALLRKGRVSVSDGNVVSFRSRTRDGEIVARESVMPAVSNVMSMVRDSGYYIAGLGQAVQAPTNGVLTVRVDSGRVGEVRVAFQGVTNEVGEVASDGRWYSGKQIRRRFDDSASGKPFDYGALYDALADVNESQDVSVNTDVKIRQERADDGSVSRLADLWLEVREAMPIHGSLEVGNDGSAQSGHWWLGATLRHQNLTRHDDILSVEAQTSLRDSSLYAISGSYLLPHDWGKGGTIGVYGAYSELDINSLVSGIGVSGYGKYAGLRISQRLLETRDHRIELAVGQTYRWTTENLRFAGLNADSRDATVAPYYAQLSWQQKRIDMLGGRTFAMLEVSRNFGDWLGTSADADMERMRVGAEADYTIGRVQLARLQALSGLDALSNGLDSRWTLFARASGQISDGPLLAVEQFGLGGAATVRGYEEREKLGDNAAFGSVELRTPVLAGALPTVMRWLGNDDWTVRDRLQFVAFVDGGWTGLRQRQPGEDSNGAIWSTGLGLRYAISQNALLRFDWGFPLKDTYESDIKGRGHLNFQLQF